MKLRETTLTLQEDGRFAHRDPYSGKTTVLDPDLIMLLTAIGRGDSPDDWGESQGINARTVAVCIEQLSALGLIQTEAADETGAQRQGGPAFILSTMRSGSTLLRYLLDSHPGLAVPPESKFFGAIEAFLDYPDTERALATMGHDLASVYQILSGLAHAILDGYAARQNKRRWIDKTPQNYRHIRLIENLFQENVQYVCLVRHPLDVVQSLEEMWRGHGGLERHPDLRRCVEVYGRDRSAFAHYWRQTNEVILACHRSKSARSHLVRYEDVVDNPQHVLAEILSFLGEEDDPTLVNRAFEIPHTPGYQDHKIVETAAIDTSRIHRWKRWTPAEVAAIAPIVEDLAVDLGYAPLTG